MNREATYTVVVEEDKVGLRLDRLLAVALPDLSRSRLQGLIDTGRVIKASDDQPLSAAQRTRAGEVFVVSVPEPPPAEPAAQSRDLDIVFEDDHLLVIDKPAGLVVHPGAGNPDQTLVNALLAHCPDGLSSVGGGARPGIVHRLDKDTSGLIVAAKSDVAHLSLARQFAEHSVERVYLAVVWGNPKATEGRIELGIMRSRSDRRKMAAVTCGGRAARTDYVVRQRFGTFCALIECRPGTGRTHQIRVHLAALGHPLVGDDVYGSGRRRAVSPMVAGATKAVDRHALHAHVIGFDHPTTGKRHRYSSELPCDINKLLQNLEMVSKPYTRPIW